jgi:L-iditol 2-dehydrogenase
MMSSSSIASPEHRTHSGGAVSLPPRMRAIVFERAGAYAVTDVPTPRPGRGEALIRVRASMVCATDQKILAGKFPATTFPHVPGHEFSGEIVATGDGVSVAPGTRVGVEVHVGCGTCDRCREGMYTLCLNYGKRESGHAHVGFTIAGGLAEYAAVPATALHPLPESVSFEDGAWTDNLGVALWALERGRLAAGERVVVFGPGAIGQCAVQLAWALGAGEVFLVGRGKRLEDARDLAEPVDASLVDRFIGTADLVVEFAGTADAARHAIVTARRGGRVVLGGATGVGTELSGVDLSTIVRGNLDVLGSLANPKGASARGLALLATGKVDVERLVTHHFPLEQFDDAWRTFTERRDGAIRVMLHPARSS